MIVRVDGAQSKQDQHRARIEAPDKQLRADAQRLDYKYKASQTSCRYLCHFRLSSTYAPSKGSASSETQRHLLKALPYEESACLALFAIMQFKLVALTLAAAASMVNAYAITGDGVNCRTGPSTNDKVVKSYEKGADVKLTCQTYGEDVKGNNIWDKTTDGCYVTDYYVKTGSSSMVTKECGGGSPGDGNSDYNGKITRKEIISRGQYWVSRHIPYSMNKVYPDPNGRKYRTDCSGFVSMALHANSPGYSTVSLPEIAKPISWDDLKPGDLVGTLGPGTGGAAGHVTLFLSWADSSKKEYNTLECRGTYGCVAYKRPVGWKDGSFTAKPYRYIRVVD
ncbi:uncharacterized protein YraJ [Aspergillus udagawae]|uniref:Uncharacterized protein YraJ n=1 Tax=Aspergillus udagawae TaxID=91492 RepID=A0A8H3S020_9EURO|nr:uncharacterized protein YraJ [Aspergillus udagawae]